MPAACAADLREELLARVWGPTARAASRQDAELAEMDALEEAGCAGDAGGAGLDRLNDDELIGVLRAARRLASWSAALELAAVTDLATRREAEAAGAGSCGPGEHIGDEIAAALTLTARAADVLLDLATALRRLPATMAALAAGRIDRYRAAVIADELAGLGDEHATAVEQQVLDDAPGQTTGQLRAAARR